MAYSKVERIAHDLAEPIAREAGCYVYDVEYVKEGGFWFLRVLIDKEETGVSLDECESVSKLLSRALDGTDPIPQNYYLEVSSPGVDRKLKRAEHFARYVGELVEISLFAPLDGQKHFAATLLGFTDGVIRVKTEEREYKIPQKDAAAVKLFFEW